jgi:FMN phosphatase YigB (HAD superfamily)
MNRAAALCFDLNGTLLDLSRTREGLALTCAEIAAQHPAISASRLLHCNTDVWRAYWPEVERRWTLGQLGDEAVGLEAWRRALRACGCYEENLVHKARQAHRRRTRELTRVFEDVQYLFDWLSGGYLPLAVVTNGASGSQREGLRILGNERRFSTVVISGEVHVPDHEIHSLRQLVDLLHHAD